jgi:hypothetical protein
MQLLIRKEITQVVFPSLAPENGKFYEERFILYRGKKKSPGNHINGVSTVGTRKWLILRK